jgi:hypothetical protein
MLLVQAILHDGSVGLEFMTDDRAETDIGSDRHLGV